MHLILTSYSIGLLNQLEYAFFINQVVLKLQVNRLMHILTFSCAAVSLSLSRRPIALSLLPSVFSAFCYIPSNRIKKCLMIM